jgi:hypothetical protein
MISFFEKHGNILKDLTFTDISLESSPHALFTAIRDILDLQILIGSGNLGAKRKMPWSGV